MRSPRPDRFPALRYPPRLRPDHSWMPFPIRLRLARVRAAAVRHRVLRRIVAVAAVLTLGATVAGTLAGAREARNQWGDAAAVVVAGSAAPIGTHAGDLDLDIRLVPVAMVPPDAFREVASLGDHLVVPVQAGEVLTMRDFASTRAEVDHLPDGTRAVAFPIDAAIPLVRVGDSVDLIVVGDPFDGEGGITRALRPPAIVVAVSDEALTLAVDVDVVRDVVSARAEGRITMAAR